MPNPQKATYFELRKVLCDALLDLSILAGEQVGPSNLGWQDVAADCVINLRKLANQMEQASIGNHESAIVFPSPEECLLEATQ